MAVTPRELSAPALGRFSGGRRRGLEPLLRVCGEQRVAALEPRDPPLRALVGGGEPAQGIRIDLDATRAERARDRRDRRGRRSGGLRTAGRSARAGAGAATVAGTQPAEKPRTAARTSASIIGRTSSTPRGPRLPRSAR